MDRMADHKRKAHPSLTRTILVTTLLIVAAFADGEAQRWPFELWHEGKIVLLNGDTLRGSVKYDLEQNVVQYGTTADKTLEAYSSRKILFFEIFDKTVNRYRQFYSLPYSHTGSYQTPTFFELLVDGKLTLLSREALEYRTYSYGFYGGSYTRQILVDRFFFLDDKGNIEQFTGGRGDLLNMMGKSADNVDKYMRSNRLRVEEKYDFARIVSYYNSLHRS